MTGNRSDLLPPASLPRISIRVFDGATVRLRGQKTRRPELFRCPYPRTIALPKPWNLFQGTQPRRLLSAPALSALLLLSLLWLPLTPAWAADPPDKGGLSGSGQAAKSDSDDALTPDRPGFTNGSDTVAPGRVQLEMGAARTKDSAANGGGQATDAPQALVRAGLNDRTELRLTLPDYIWPSGGAAGFGDGAVGLRYKFYGSKDGNTKLAFTPSVSIPVRSAVTSSGHLDPTFSLNGQTKSGARWSLESNLILSYPTQGGGRVTDYTATGQVTYALTSALSVFGDYYYDAPVGSAPSPVADGGFTYQVGRNVQLDIETGRGLGGNAPVQFYGGGVSLRF